MCEEGLILRRIKLAPLERWNHSPEGWLFLLIDEGHGVYSWRSGSLQLGHGDAMVVRAGLGGWLTEANRAGLDASYFRFFPEQFTVLLSLDEWRHLETATDDARLARHFPAQNPLAQQFQSFVNQGMGPTTLACRCQMLELIAASLADEDLPSTNASLLPARLNHHAHRLPANLGQITAEEFQTLSVEELARKCGYSRRHLNRIFQEQFGRSVMEIKIQLRLEKASILLRHPDAKIINVALDCGFTHLGLFSHKFRERFGASPSQWRKDQLRPDSSPEQQPESPVWLSTESSVRVEVPQAKAEVEVKTKVSAAAPKKTAARTAKSSSNGRNGRNGGNGGNGGQRRKGQ